MILIFVVTGNALVIQSDESRSQVSTTLAVCELLFFNSLSLDSLTWHLVAKGLHYLISKYLTVIP